MIDKQRPDGNVGPFALKQAQARRLAELVKKAEDRQQLLADLETISLPIA